MENLTFTRNVNDYVIEGFSISGKLFLYLDAKHGKKFEFNQSVRIKFVFDPPGCSNTVSENDQSKDPQSTDSISNLVANNFAESLESLKTETACLVGYGDQDKSLHIEKAKDQSVPSTKRKRVSRKKIIPACKGNVFGILNLTEKSTETMSIENNLNDFMQVSSHEASLCSLMDVKDIKVEGKSIPDGAENSMDVGNQGIRSEPEFTYDEKDGTIVGLDVENQDIHSESEVAGVEENQDIHSESEVAGVEENQDIHSESEVASVETNIKAVEAECIYCKVSFPSQNDLNLHRHTPSLNVKCQICNAEFATQASLILHEFEAHKSFSTSQDLSSPVTISKEEEEKLEQNKNRPPHLRYVPCPICSCKITQNILVTHIMRKHTDESPFQCCVCKLPCINLPKYHSHGKTHLDLQCLFCSAVFQTKSEMDKHAVIHNNECIFCNQDFSFSKFLKNHYLKDHFEQMLKCDQCDQRFPTSDKLRNHKINIHFTKMKLCPICGIPCKRLSRHMESAHEGSKKFYCSQCPKVFTRERYLQAHEKRHLDTQTGSRIKCPQCTNTYLNNSQLFKHMNRIHFNSKKCMCAICGLQTNDSYNLKVHMRIHSATKCFTCQVCGQGFNYKASLRGHMKSRHGTEDYH